MKYANDPVDHESFVHLADTCHEMAEQLAQTRKDVKSIDMEIGWIKLVCLAQSFVIVCLVIALIFR